MSGFTAHRVPVALVVPSLLLLCGCPMLATLPPPRNVAAGLQAEYLAAGIPTSSAVAAYDDGRIFFAEKDTGRIRLIKDGVLLEEPFAQVPVNYAGERGLLDIALHPRFRDNRRLYVFYTRSDTGASTSDPRAVIDNRVVYFEAIPDTSQEPNPPGDVAAGGEVFVASLPINAALNRIGGRIAFAHDRTLYVALGDLGDANAAQDPNSLQGKILRYNDDGTVPEDNAVPRYPRWASGFRSPAALRFDPESRVAFVIDQSDVGHHEFNRIVPGGNYGWPEVQGFVDTPAEEAFAEANPSYQNPLSDSGDENVWLIGIAFNPSAQYGPAQRIRMFYGDRANLRILSAGLDDTREAITGFEVFATRFPGAITDVAFTPSGTLYVACQNSLMRIVNFTTVE